MLATKSLSAELKAANQCFTFLVSKRNTPIKTELIDASLQSSDSNFSSPVPNDTRKVRTPYTSPHVVSDYSETTLSQCVYSPSRNSDSPHETSVLCVPLMATVECYGLKLLSCNLNSGLLLRLQATCDASVTLVKTVLRKCGFRENYSH